MKYMNNSYKSKKIIVTIEPIRFIDYAGNTIVAEVFKSAKKQLK